jgi:heterodisulfide reductase subunit A-like polyferredoxin
VYWAGGAILLAHVLHSGAEERARVQEAQARRPRRCSVRDIRTYGFKERLYTEARRQGVLFVRYDDDHRPAVSFPDNAPEIVSLGSAVGEGTGLRPDLLVLSMPQVPAEGTEELVSKLRVSVDLDGWFMEAHVKLRPVDFASEGIFMAGAAHYPKFLDEAIVQAQAAAARAANILAHDTRTVGGQVAVVEADKCVGCLTCVRICPFDVPEIKSDLLGVGGIRGAATSSPPCARDAVRVSRSARRRRSI